MLNDFNNILQFSISPAEALLNLAVALVCGLIISFFYRGTYKGGGFTISFLNSLVVLTMITAVVIMVIGNNLARAFGLVGAMSIIRFRTALKETLDIIFIFFALAMGMAAGVGLHVIALTATILIGSILYILMKTNIVYSVNQEYLLQFNIKDSDKAGPEYSKIIDKYCKKSKLINIKSVNVEGITELSYHVNLKSDKNGNDFVKALKGISEVTNVNLFFDEEYF